MNPCTRYATPGNSFRRRSLAALVITHLLLGAACGPVFAGAGKVLVFANKRQFNDPVLSRTVALLRHDGYTVTRMAGKTLGEETAQGYGAVVVFNFTDKGNSSFGVRVMAGESVQKRIVLFNAVGRDYLTPPGDPAGTREEMAAGLAAELAQKVKLVMSQQHR